MTIVELQNREKISLYHHNMEGLAIVDFDDDDDEDFECTDFKKRLADPDIQKLLKD
jgi:hypothetical protein